MGWCSFFFPECEAEKARSAEEEKDEGEDGGAGRSGEEEEEVKEESFFIYQPQLFKRAKLLHKASRLGWQLRRQAGHVWKVHARMCLPPHSAASDT